MHLLGSNDGIVFDTLAEIFEDIDPLDSAMPGMSDTFQITHLLAGTNYPKYQFYKFRWYIENGAATEAFPTTYNFIKLSLYKL